jgi:hypothetical protein
MEHAGRLPSRSIFTQTKQQGDQHEAFRFGPGLLGRLLEFCLHIRQQKLIEPADPRQYEKQRDQIRSLDDQPVRYCWRFYVWSTNVAVEGSAVAVGRE